MKYRLIKKCLLLLLIILLHSCSSTANLMSFWEDEGFESAIKNKTMVIGVSDQQEVRRMYEDKVKEKLTSKNLNVIQSYKVFPGLRKKKKWTEEEQQQILKTFKKEGIGTILIMSLKETKVLKKRPEPTKPIAANANYGKYVYSFTEMYSVNSERYLNDMVKSKYTNSDKDRQIPELERKSTQYIIETLLYDISKEKPKQFVAAYEVSIIDPDSAKEVLNQFAKIIADQIVK